MTDPGPAAIPMTAKEEGDMGQEPDPADKKPVAGEKRKESSAAEVHWGWEAAMIVLLLVVTGLILGAGNRVLTDVEKDFGKIYRVKWQPQEGVGLKPGPPSFWHDASKHELVHIGAIDSKRKHELTTLFSSESKEPGSQQRAFWAAIDELAFVSVKDQGGLLAKIILLGGLAGALGVQLRSLVNFVGHACYTKTLDLKTWWPYYVVRPFTGFLLGVTIVVIIQAGLMTVGNSTPSGALWWAGLALLAGFGEQEFTQRLRQLTKALFGESAVKSPLRPGGAEPAKPKPPEPPKPKPQEPPKPQ